MKKNENVYIIGKKIILIPYKKRHVAKYHHWMQSSELRELTASESLTLEEEYEMQRKWHDDDDKCTFIILSKNCYQNTLDEEVSMIGDTNMFFCESGDYSEAEIEIMIADLANRGKGYGKEALLLMMRYGVEELGVKRYIAKVITKNIRSQKLFEKIGFIQCGENKVFQEVIFEFNIIDKIHHEFLNDTSYKLTTEEELGNVVISS